MEHLLNLPVIRWFHNLSYRIKLSLVFLLLLLAVAASIYFMIDMQQKLISLIENQKKENSLESNLRSLEDSLIRHHILLKRYENGEDSLKNELLQLQTTVVGNLQTLQQKNKRSVLTNDKLHESTLLKDITDDWQEIIKNPFDEKNPPSNRLYQGILQKLNNWILLLNNNSSVLLEEGDFASYFIDTSVLGIPLANLQIDNALQNAAEGKAGNVVQISKLETAVQNNISAVQKGINQFQKTPNNEVIDLTSLQENLASYGETSEDLINYTRKKNTPSWNAQDYLVKLEKLSMAQSSLWESLFEINNGLLTQQLDNLYRKRTFAIPFVAICSLLALFLFLVIFIELYVPFRNTIDAVEKFAKGDLSSRAKIYFNDETGRIAGVLNHLGDNFEHIIEQLHRTGIQLTTSTTEIAAAAKQQEITVVEQEATTKEIAVTAGEISATAKEFAKTINSISQAAEQTSTLATSGKDGLTQMESIMRQMVEASANIASRLGVLNEKAGSITSVVTTIAKVADQTNLLSLNASIEAEKAGEMGRSFAVIAREIRRLADQTANATVDIEKMVNEMGSAVSSAVMGVDKFTEEIRSGVSQVTRIGEVLSQIIEQVQGLTTSFENVNQGMRNQTLGAEQINEAINQLSDVAQQTSASIRQFHNAIEQLNMAARDMQSSASKIKHN
ncbi:MAG: methyl-accepting chemotaxis protein [Parachlamydiales bacterium]|jgi:methyl-accepting chemotaxis protein WspA